MDVELAWSTEHFLGWTAGVRFDERFAPRPGDKVFYGFPPSFYLVVAFYVRVVDKRTCFVIEPHWTRTMNFVANKTGRLADEMDPVAKAILEIDLMALGHGNAIGDDDYRVVLNINCTQQSPSPRQ